MEVTETTQYLQQTEDAQDPSQPDSDSGYGDLEEPERNHDPFKQLYGLRMPFYFIAMALMTLPLYEWSREWWISGTPLLMMCLLSGNFGHLSRSSILLGGVLSFINLNYALCSTSWLLSRVFRTVTYSTTVILAIVTSRRCRSLIRRGLRRITRQLNFVDDKIAFFNIPALNIDDGDVPCLLVVRGITFNILTMTVEVHGIEVGVQINEDLEVAIQTDLFQWKIMREIRIGDVYGSLKGPFTLKNKHKRDLNQDNPAATVNLTDGVKPKETENLSDLKSVTDHDALARKTYQDHLRRIHETDIILRARERVSRYPHGPNAMRAAIGAETHEDSAVPNPPSTEIKSSVLVDMVPRWVKRIFETCPVLLRLFLNPVSYNHPVHFGAVIMTGCGEYVNQILDQQFFKYYPQENKEIRKLQGQIKSYLGNGKFSLVLPDILGFASVPYLTQYDIVTHVKAPLVLVYKTLRATDNEPAHQVEEIMKITGISNTAVIPSCLLPHHEYLFPDPPEDIQEPDEVEIKLALLGSLPGEFAPEMVEFVITLIKASQILTLHKQANSMSEEVHSAKDFGKSLSKATLEQTKKKLVEAHVDDGWLHKLTLKAFQALRKTKGDAGYQMILPVNLDDLRPTSFMRRASMMASSTQNSRNSSISNASTGSNAPGIVVM